MARPARLVLPGIPHHVTARGARREPTFFSNDDYARYVALLRHGCAKAGTAIWAWCLMPNHVHLLLVPDRPDGLAAAIGRAHRRYALEINQRQGWCGAFWQGRFGSVPLDERRLHICFRYVELNPVRARLAGRAEGWRWSSARAHLGVAADPLTDLAPARERIDDWRAFLEEGLDPDDHAALRAAERRRRTHRPLPLGFPLGAWHRSVSSVPGTEAFPLGPWH